MKYKTNHNVVYSCRYHVVWCPKYRRKVLTGEIETRLRELIMETANGIRAEITELEIMPDHVHLQIEVDPQYGINRAIRHIKGVSSHALRSEFPSLKSRLPTLWTNAYFVSTVGGAPLEAIRKYIENQKNV
jgi:putative transposase